MEIIENNNMKIKREPIIIINIILFFNNNIKTVNLYIIIV